jgi:hypothetical protein
MGRGLLLWLIGFDFNHPSDLATRRPTRLGVTNTEQAADTGQQISLARVIGYARRIG